MTDKQMARAIETAIYHLHEGLTCELPETAIGWAARKRFEMALEALASSKKNRAAKPSPAQLGALASAARWKDGGSYMPYMNQKRTFEALERKGLVAYQQANCVLSQHAGYVLTDAGRLALSQAKA